MLFDIDGTLLLTGGAGFRAMASVTRVLFDESFRWEGIDPSGGLDPLLFAEAARRNGRSFDADVHEAFRRAYAKALAGELEQGRSRIRLMPGVPSVLERLRALEHVVLGLVSGNYAATGPLKVAAAGIPPEWFPVQAFGDEAPDREALVALALERLERTSAREDGERSVIVVGDTPRDIESAHANGCHAFAVATGRFTLEELRAAGADTAVADLSDPTPLLELVG